MALPVSVFYPKKPEESSSQPKIKVKKALEQITSSQENLPEAPPLSERIAIAKIKNPMVKIIKLGDLPETKKRIIKSAVVRDEQQQQDTPVTMVSARPVLVKARPKSVMKPREFEAQKNPTKVSKKMMI